MDQITVESTKIKSTLKCEMLSSQENSTLGLFENQ